MDERILFDQFHEALDMEPRPGAYERMRIEMTTRPVALKGGRAFQMRWSTMGLRVAAVLAAAVIALALGAAILATHHGPQGSVPAQDPNVTTYQAMVVADYDGMVASTSNHCNTIQDTGCQAAIKPVLITLQKWLDDLNTFPTTPNRFATIDGQLRRHLSGVIADLSEAAAFQRASNQSGFDFAMNAAFYERAWVDPAKLAIEGAYPSVAGSYRAEVALLKRALDGCTNGAPGPAELACQRQYVIEPCGVAQRQNCEVDVENAATQLELYFIALAQNPPPASLTSKAALLQADLAKADTALLAITDALLRGDSDKAHAGQMSFAAAIEAADLDVYAASNF